MAKLIVLNTKDLDGFLKYLKVKGYDIIEGEHAVLTDNSEIEEFCILKNNELKGLILAHYITPYYKAVIENKDKSDDELLRALIRVKYSGEKWRTPVNPVALITDDPSMEDIVKNYEDNYPSEDAEKYSKHYKSSNPNRVAIFRNALAHVLSRLSREK